jgi:hypothetical protein
VTSAALAGFAFEFDGDKSSTTDRWWGGDDDDDDDEDADDDASGDCGTTKMPLTRGVLACTTA